MRILYAPVHEGIHRALADIFEGGYPADKVIQRQHKLNKKWGSHDRRLFAEAVYDLVRWWRRLLFAVGVAWPEEDGTQGADREVVDQIIALWCELHEVELGRNLPKLKTPG